MLKPSSVAGALMLAIFAATAIACSTGKSTGATMAPRQTLRALVGRWECITRDSRHRTWREADNDTAYGRWLREAVTYPAQNGQAAQTGVNYFGYDAAHRRWIFASFDRAGGYSISYSTSPHFDSSHWSAGYPRTGGSVVVTMPDGNTYTAEERIGSTAISHTVCTRS